MKDGVTKTLKVDATLNYSKQWDKTPDGKLIYEKVSEDKGEDSAVNVIAGPSCYGDELMNLGLITSDTSAGEIVGEDMPCGDYDSRLYVLKAE